MDIVQLNNSPSIIFQILLLLIERYHQTCQAGSLAATGMNGIISSMAIMAINIIMKVRMKEKRM